MVRVKKEYVLATCLTSGIAIVLGFVSLGTEQWIVADGSLTTTDKPSFIQYGLFSGTYEQTAIGLGTVYVITMTCSFGDNACAVLCKKSASERNQEIKKLLDENECPAFDTECPHVARTFKPAIYDADPNSCAGSDRTFINSGCYLTTVMFLILSCVCGTIATILSVWNSGGNPVYDIFGILGIYCFNGLAAGFTLLAICIWGSEYTANLIDNPAILLTITNVMTAKGRTYLGFSYWIMLPSLFLYVVSIVLLYLREKVIKREPLAKIDIDDIPDTIIMY